MPLYRCCRPSRRGSTPAWRKAQRLLIGAVLAPGKRTVTACLRALGRHRERDFALYHQVLNRGRRHKTLTDWARQPSLRQRLDDPKTVWPTVTVRWYDGRRKALEYATGTALWYHPGQPTVPLRWVLLRDPAGIRAPMALLCTASRCRPHRIVAWFLRRWQIEVTFQAVRAHLGGETQRPWAAPAIARTTPALLGLFSWITLAAHALLRGRSLQPRRAAWYPKTAPTFTDALALVRATLRTGEPPFSRSRPPPNMAKSPPLAPERLWDFLCYTA